MNIDPSSSPLAYFADELKRLRAAAGMTQQALGDVTGYTGGLVGSVETCIRLPGEDFARRADEALSANGSLVRLQALVEQTSVLPWFRDLVKVEKDADEIRVYASYQIPALLQTEDYMRAAAQSWRPTRSESDIDSAVALRLTRQGLLDIDEIPPVNLEIRPRLWAIIDESVLTRVVGSTEIMRAQCEHLAQMAGRPNVTIQIVPNGAGITAAFGRAFVIMISKHETLVYLEDINSARYVRKTDEANSYVLAFDHLRASALDERKSLNMIKAASK